MAVVNGTAGMGGQGKPPQTVTWSLAGNTKPGTTLSTSGLLTVAADEPVGTELTITATSTVDTSKSNSIKTKVIDGPSVTMGAQTGALTYHGADAAAFAVTASGFATAPAAGDYTLSWFSDAAGTAGAAAPGLTVTKTSASTLTIAPGTANAGTYYFKLTATKGSEHASSSVVTATVGKATATTAMTTVTTSVSKDGATGATVTLPTKPAAATYGTIAYGGAITCSNPSVNGDTLTYTAPASTVGDTGTITIPVTTATNYNDYDIVVTITSTDKTALTVTGVSVANKPYNGTSAVKSGNPVYTLVGGGAVSDYTGTWDYLYTSTDGGGYSAATAPTNAGAYMLTVTANDTKYVGKQEIAFTVSKAAITIRANNKSAYVGDTAPALSASDCTITGLATGEHLATAPTVAYAGTPDMSKTGTVTINVSGAALPASPADANYNSTITYLPGTLTISAKSSGGGSSSGNTGSSVTVDGKTESIGKVETKNDATTVVVDSGKLDAKVSAAKSGSSVVVPVSTTEDSASAQLVVESVEKMAAKDMTLEVKSGKTTYALPAAAIDTKGVIAQLGATDAAEVPFTVTITGEKNVKVEGSTLVVPAVSFTVSASYDGKTVAIDRFDTMVARTIEVTKAQAAKITTAVVVEANGTARHVPTSVYEQGGKWYAKINSMTNSTYALIINESKPTDVSGKWYEAAANELSAREVTDGVFTTAFEGEKNITRAEFAALLVNGLGLPKGGTADFTDVAADAWYSKALATAVEYGVVKGVGRDEFAPDATITRQEAMVMIQRAASVVGYTGGGTESGSFADRNEVGAWAADGVAFNLANGLIVGSDGKISPKETITRAETATVLLRLLQKAELVDVRAEVS